MSKSLVDIIASINRKGTIPSGDKRFNATGTMEAFVDEALINDVYPTFVPLNENFNVVKDVVSMSSTEHGTGLVPLPIRCYAQGIREVKWRADSDSGLVNMPRVSLDDTDLYDYSDFGPSDAYRGFHPLGDAIQLVGSREEDFQNISGETLFHYVPRPPAMTQDTTIEVLITDVSYSSGTTTFTLDTIGAGFNTYLPDAGIKKVDIYRKTTGGIVAHSVLVTRSSSTLTTTQLTEAQANGFEAWQPGDFPLATGFDAALIVTPEDQSLRTPLPTILDDYLETCVVSRMLLYIQDDKGYSMNEDKRRRTKADLIKMLGRRVRGEGKKITNRRGIGAYTRHFRRR